MSQSRSKTSYTIPCSSAFRDAASALADRRGINVADLARSIILTLPMDTVVNFPDPGEPDPGDRQTVILKSGRSKGRPWQRKPRLQVRMVPGLNVAVLRRALNMALAMDQGRVEVHVEAPDFGLQSDLLRRQRGAERADAEVTALKAAVAALVFEPLKNDVETRADALYVMGYHAMARPTAKDLRARFRLMATIHHPDSDHGSHVRMSQLNNAMTFLKNDND